MMFQQLTVISWSLAAVLPSSSAGPTVHQAVPSPFHLEASAPAQPYTTLTIAEDGYQRLREVHTDASAFRLSGFPISAGQTVDLLLRPLNIMPSDAAIVVVGERETRSIEPTVLTFSGIVTDHPGSYVYLSLSRNQAHGYIDLADHTYVLSTGDPKAADGTARLATTDVLFAQQPEDPWVCQVMNDLQPPGDRRQAQGGALGFAQVQIADVFIECDHDFRNLFPSAEDAADYAVALISAVSDIYRRDLGVEIRIPDEYLRVWETVPPWGVITGFGDINSVANYWTSPGNPLNNIPRAAVHVLTTPVFGGVALAATGLCSNNLGYEISSVNGFFPVPVDHTNPGNWDLIVVAHEFGHTFGSVHTFNYNPPIQCNDGSGPDNGTIMSYCHLNAGGVNNVGLRFHGVVQDHLRNDLNNVNCLEIIDIQIGDYDHNGILDDLDLQAADMCLNLEFDAAGCLETFDVDGNGQLTIADLFLLVNLVDPCASGQDCNGNSQNDCDDISAGTSSDCNGNSIPDECLTFEADCNGNSTPDACDIADGLSLDIDNNGVPDECHAIFQAPSAEHPTIQSAIDAAADGDSVLVPEGVHTGPGNKELTVGTKAILISGTAGAEQCIIDCQGSGRGFAFNYLDLPGTVIRGLTIRNGLADRGAGVLFEDGSRPTLRECILINNEATSSGGGIHCQDSNPIIENCVVVDNVASGSGGGISCHFSSPLIIGTVIAGNSTGGAGGGLNVMLDSDPLVRNTLITGNTSNLGGAAHVVLADLTVQNSTLAGNSASSSGAAMHVSGSTQVTVENSILWGNTGPQAGQIVTSVSSAVVTIAYSNLQDGQQGFEGVGTLEWGAGNLDTDPLFVDLDGPDDDPLIWQDNDLHLLGASPAIDAGDPAFLTLPNETDIDGQSRVLGPGLDMGADEFLACTADVTGDGSVNAFDLGLMLGDWGACPGCATDANGDGEVDAADLAELLGQWGACN